MNLKYKDKDNNLCCQFSLFIKGMEENHRDESTLT